MAVRVLGAGTAEVDAVEPAEAVLGGIEARMLTRKNDCRLEAARRQCLSDRCKLDGFGSRPDDEDNVREAQPSP